MISYFREKPKAGAVYKTDFGDGFVIWKLLPWRRYKIYREARVILGAKIDAEIEEAVYEEAVIFSSYDDAIPVGLDEEEEANYLLTSRGHQPAGIVSTVVKIILHRSGAMNAKQVFGGLEEQRSYIANVESQLVTLVCRAFPSYTPEQLEDLDWPTFLQRVAQAELILMGYNLELPLREQEPPEPENKPLDIDKMIRESEREYGRMSEEARADLEATNANLREEYLRSRAGRR